MMMKVLLALLLVVVAVYAQPPTVNFPNNITSMSVTNLDVIFLDGPAWVTRIERSWMDHEFFVYGDKTLRTINVGFNRSFYAAPDNDPLSHPLLDSHTFFANNTNTNTLWKYTIGVAEYIADDDSAYAGVTGPYLPFFSAIFNTASSTTSALRLEKNTNTTTNGNNYNPDLSGFMMYAVRSDYSIAHTTNNTIIVYFAGFYVNPTTATIQFVLLRTYYTIPYGLFSGSPFSFDITKDLFVLYSDKFTTFSESYKPWIHVLSDYASNHSVVIVVDPNTKTVYSVDLLFNKTSTVSFVSFDSTDNTLYDVVSSSFQGGNPFVPNANKPLYVGLAATGLNPGVIFTFNLAVNLNANAYTLPALGNPIRLPTNYSNPKAIVADFDALYIGLNGWNEILKYNLSNGAFAYQRLPEFLHRTWDGTLTRDHVYFVTYEQNSKVFRVNKTDFCPATCPYFGYCSNGQCACWEGFELNKKKTDCVLKIAEKEVIYEKHYKTAHGGEIALGILFALTFIAGGAGWALWYRSRHGAYQSV